MDPSRRPQYHIDLGHLNSFNSLQPRSDASANSSPIEASQPTNSRFPASSSSSGLGSLSNPSTNRLGAGSPSHEHGGRPFSRRAREIQASEGISHQAWGPPTASGLSTPLRETIPESPNDDGFPDLAPGSLDVPSRNSSLRRTRAGTVPSRFPAGSDTPPSTTQPSQPIQSTRPAPSESPFRPGTASVPESANTTSKPISSAALLSRFRAGSGPPRSSFTSSQSAFGPSMFSSAWNRDRAGSLMSYTSGDLGSPTQSSFLKDSMADTDVKTLDYLGLVDPPQQNISSDAPSYLGTGVPSFALGARPLMSDVNRVSSNRFRSYSVNAKEKYADSGDSSPSGYPSGNLTPAAQSAAAALAATQAQIHKHNLDVQAFVNQATSNRPRARTAGLLDSPSSRMWKGYNVKPSRLDSSITASDLSLDQAEEYQNLTNAVQALQLQGEALQQELAANGEKSRALWLGGIPASTTPSSLKVIFEAYGKIESARVLTHKSCGFINFENLESAIRAKSQLNGKEIFPGGGPIRIGYAKAPSANGTPGANGINPSPSPDFTSRTSGDVTAKDTTSTSHTSKQPSTDAQSSSTDLPVPHLQEIVQDILTIVKDFGATDEETLRISEVLDQACQFDSYAADIPPLSEPSQNRIHDAPKLREIRKRIDNNAYTLGEVEEIALHMLPEIAELASDYLGNTVVQKLFEFCSEDIKEAMLREIGPHLAEIGVHKNGTWAAQKIIDVARTPAQMHVIVENLRPYGVGSFLDQYGNYVMQCCLRFGYPWNSFIFECMLSRLWHLAQGRFGARAMRACLESHHATKDQQRMVAASIAIHSVRLATNANGALLLTWFLDTCNFPHRRTILAPRLIPHLVQLCTHKVAYLTVLKLINQRSEPDARDALLKALFFSPEDQVLTDILKDQSCGATLIFKVLTTPFFEEQMRAEVVHNTRKVLQEIKAQPSQGYKRLMDEVGLSTRSSGGGNARDSTNSGSNRANSLPRPSSKQGHANSNINNNNNLAQAQPGMSAPLNGFGPGPAQAPYGPNHNLQPPMSSNMIPNGAFENQTFTGNHNIPSPMTPHTQIHYQPNMVPHQRPPPMYNFNSPPMMNGYGSPMPQSMDSYRNMPPRNQMASPQLMNMPQSPMMPQAGYAQPAYNPMMSPGSQGMWQYPAGYVMSPQQQMQVQGMMGSGAGGGGGVGGPGGGGGRRGRR